VCLLRKNQTSHCLKVKVVVPYPSEFIKRPQGQAEVRRVIAAKYPDDLAKLPCLPKRGNLLLCTDIPGQAAVPHHPPFIGIRPDNVIGRAKQALMIKKFDRLCAVRLPHLLKAKGERSSNPGADAWHLAIWSIYAGQPRISAESRGQNPVAAAAVDGFLAAVKRHVAPVINLLLQTYAPATWKRHQR
jgi:hypothetical protein